MVDTETGTLESLVVADLGRGTSRAYLLEHIGGAFRFVAKAEGRSATDQPFEELSHGWQHLLHQLEWMSGRGLTTRDRLASPQLASGDGVDGLIICASTAEPVRVVVLEAGQSPVTPPLLESLRRVNTRVFQISAPAGRKDGGWAAAQVDAVRAFQPEMAIVVSGAGAQDALPRVIQLSKQIGMIGSLQRAIVVADGPAQEQASASFGGKVKVRSVSPVVRQPADIAAEIERELNDTFQLRLAAEGLDGISGEALRPPVTRTHAVDHVNRFVARAFQRRVLTIGIDDGVHVHWSNGEQGAMAALPHLDLNAAITGLSGREVADAAVWLPFETTEDELVTWVLNRSIRPWTLSESPRDAVIEQALCRQVVRRAIGDVGRAQPMALTGIDLVIGGPLFARWNQPGAAALALLDAVDVVPNDGVLDLALDADGLMAVTGAIGMVDPSLASSIFEYDTLVHLGSAVIIGGPSHDGELACRGEIHYDNGEMSQFQAMSGGIEVIPLRPGETATLVLRPERKYSVGGQPSGKTVTLTDERRIIGGAVGVIVDARPRSLATGGPGRDQRVRQWLDTVNGKRTSAIRRFT